MGRAERRKQERRTRIEDSKDKITLTRWELEEEKRKARTEACQSILAAAILAEHRVHKFGKIRALRTLNYMNTLMDEIIQGKASIDLYKQQVYDEVDIKLVFQVR